MEVNIRINGTEDEVHGFLEHISGIRTDEFEIDDIRSQQMNLHQNLLRLEKKIPDPLKMWEAINDRPNKKTKE